MTTTPEVSDTDLRHRLRGEPGVTPEDTRSELLQDGQSKVLRNNLRGEPDVSPEDTYSELLAAKAKEDHKAQESKPVVTRTTEEHTEAVDKALKAQLEDDLRRRKMREQEEAGLGLNSVDVQRSGKELERGDFIVPRRITQAYTEVDGKFYAKDSNRVMFEDKGDKLATSTTNKEAVADMVAYAKAKQWDSLKLSGSQEFRREAWLQAESQGIKTQGYTPKQSDLAALETLRQERSTNAITPLQERKTARETVGKETTPAAPRHDMNKNQAAMHAEAGKSITTHMQALQKQPGMTEKSVEDLTKLAYWRGIVAEENTLQPKAVQDEAMARFDKQAIDPQFLKRLNQETEPKIHDKTTERVQQRETQEQSL
ncbi:MAG TPA: LPD7 domain-containing protein [Xylella sp.]